LHKGKNSWHETFFEKKIYSITVRFLKIFAFSFISSFFFNLFIIYPAGLEKKNAHKGFSAFFFQ
jgi:hypothetical protein